MTLYMETFHVWNTVVSFPPMEIKLLMSPCSGIIGHYAFSDALVVIKISGHSKLDPWKLKISPCRYFYEGYPLRHQQQTNLCHSPKRSFSNW